MTATLHDDDIAPGALAAMWIHFGFGERGSVADETIGLRASVKEVERDDDGRVGRILVRDEEHDGWRWFERVFVDNTLLWRIDDGALFDWPDVVEITVTLGAHPAWGEGFEKHEERDNANDSRAHEGGAS